MDIVERVEIAIMEAMNADPKNGSFSRAAHAALAASGVAELVEALESAVDELKQFGELTHNYEAALARYRGEA